VPPEDIVATRIRELREQHGWSQADLTRQLNRYGAGLDRSQVARVEQGQNGRGRRVPIDELILFALALDTSPMNLLFPPDNDARVALTPDGADIRVDASAREARAWTRGDWPLLFQDARFYVLSGPPPPEPRPGGTIEEDAD
jgi:transcriptional regulator with XRE-family HTH domain